MFGSHVEGFHSTLHYTTLYVTRHYHFHSTYITGARRQRRVGPSVARSHAEGGRSTSHGPTTNINETTGNHISQIRLPR